MSNHSLRINRNVLAQFLPDHDSIKQFENLMGLAIFDSDDITEGIVNLFYTEARFDASLATKDTDDLAEGVVNLYFSGKTTTNLPEGTNLYWTTARGQAVIDADTTLLKTDGSRARVAVTETIATTSTTETVDVTTCTLLRQTASGITTSLSGMVTGSRIIIKNRGGGNNTINVTIDGVSAPILDDKSSIDLIYNGTDWDAV